MESAGWKPRAAGWFTRSLADGATASVAVGTASQHYPKGQAGATAYVGVRVERIESVVSALCGFPDLGYQQRTVTKPLGHLMPEARWREWLVSQDTADAVAQELAAAITTYGLPYLDEVVSDSDKLLDAIRHSAGGDGSVGRCRQALVLAASDRLEDALAFARSCEEQVEGQNERWAEQERKWVTAFGAWAAENNAGHI